MLGRLANETIRARGFVHHWGDILPTIKESDAFLINLECALTAHEQHWTNGEQKAVYFTGRCAEMNNLVRTTDDRLTIALQPSHVPAGSE